MRPTLLASTAGLLLLAACGGREPAPGSGRDPDSGATAAPAPPADTVMAPLPAGAEARSFLGEPLYPPELPPEVRAVYEARLDTARQAFEAAPEDADSIIWLGRRLAYLGRYAEAIATYSRGIAQHPDDARLYRHRGHRFLTVRDLDSAIGDLRHAVELIRDREDEVEPDGIPNERGIPTSTLHFNVWYHLGLAHYLKGEYEQALLAWNECLAVSRHPDSVVATSYWLNNTLRRLGLEDRAQAVRARISAGMEVIESTTYLDLLLLHEGVRRTEDLLGPTGEDATLASTTAGYGVGMWHFVNGRREEAYGVWEAMLGNRDQWPAFGYLAAEAEVARAREESGGGEQP
jgi:tetratricopeptide (TPR) repeat protein